MVTSMWQMGILPGSLNRTVETSQGAHGDRPVLVVAVAAHGTVGYGEAAVLPSPLPGDPSLEEVMRALEGSHGRRLVAASEARGGAAPPSSVIAQLFGTSSLDRAVAHVLEMALLDAELRSRGEGLAAWAGVTATSAPISGLVVATRGGGPEEVAAQVEHLLGRGCRQLRVKIQPGFDREPLSWIRQVAPVVRLHGDANGAYRLDGDDRDGPRALAALADVGVDCIEQPLAANLLADHAVLRQQIALPIGLDESLASPQHVKHAIAYDALDVACIKPVRMGGLAAAVSSVNLAAKSGKDVFIGGFYETVWARSTLAVLAGHAGVTVPSDCTPPSTYGLGDDGSLQLGGAGVLVPRGVGVSGVDPEFFESRVQVWTAFPLDR
jgi:o-succinylbenzoate synthase